MSLNTLSVSPGVDLAYTDSGVPNASAPYTTIFAVHGMGFSSLIFKKLQAAAFEKGFRFVAINRRAYSGSTPFDGDERDVIVEADSADTTEKRIAFVEERGREIASFIDIFTQKHGLPPISEDGTAGGSVVFGWSLGSQFAAAALAYAPSLPSDVRSRLASHIRSLVIYDVPPFVFGLPMSEKTWIPLTDTNIPEQHRLPMFGQWVTGYFDNGDYSKRNVDTLAHVVPSNDKAPTIYSIPNEEIVCYGEEAGLDLYLLISFSEPFKTTYRKAFGGSGGFPNLKITLLAADRSAAYALSGMWAVQDDLKELGLGQNINYKILQGANHFLHWEDPEKLVEIFANDA